MTWRGSSILLLSCAALAHFGIARPAWREAAVARGADGRAPRREAGAPRPARRPGARRRLERSCDTHGGAEVGTRWPACAARCSSPSGANRSPACISKWLPRARRSRPRAGCGRRAPSRTWSGCRVSLVRPGAGFVLKNVRLAPHSARKPDPRGRGHERPRGHTMRLRLLGLAAALALAFAVLTRGAGGPPGARSAGARCASPSPPRSPPERRLPCPRRRSVTSSVTGRLLPRPPDQRSPGRCPRAPPPRPASPSRRHPCPCASWASCAGPRASAPPWRPPPGSCSSGPGDAVSGYTVLGVDEERGLRLRGPDGAEVVLEPRS